MIRYFIILLNLICCSSFAISNSEFQDTYEPRIDSLISEGLKNYNKDPEKSARLLHESLKLSAEKNYRKGLARSNHLIAQLLLKQGQQDSALLLLNKSKALYLALSDSVNNGKI